MTKQFANLSFAVSLILAICSCAPVTIETTPTGAAVYSADGKTELGTTPFDTRVFVSEKNFIVKKDRYFDETVTLNYDSERTVNATFRPLPVVLYSKPVADVYRSGSETAIGSTPIKVPVSGKPAEYTLKTKDYYDLNVTVGADTPDPMVVELTRRPIVTLSAKPAGVEIYENGTKIGTGSVIEEILSPRTFELRKAGYFSKTVTLKGAPPYEVSEELKAFPVIAVTATPANARISRAGGLLGTGSASLPVGEKTVLEVIADRFYTQAVTLTPESPATVKVDLKAMPYVMINSEPAGADVMINGKSIGMTPVEQLVEKDTVIELSKSGFVTKTATLTGMDKSVTVTLEAVPAEVQTPAVSETQPVKPSAEVDVAATTEETPVKGTNLPMILGAVAAAIIVAIIIVLKRKKK